MALHGSGAISISQIKTELGSASNSIRTLSAAAGKGTPDAMSEFYGYASLPATVTYTQYWNGGDANGRFYAWDSAGTAVISEQWYWWDGTFNLGTDTGVTFKAGYTLQVYAYNWGASNQSIEVIRNGSQIYYACAFNEVGPYTFTINSGDSIQINNNGGC
jgi:hypothetical protein